MKKWESIADVKRNLLTSVAKKTVLDQLKQVARPDVHCKLRRLLVGSIIATQDLS